MCMVGTWLLKNPPAGYQPEGWSPQAAPAERTLRDIPTAEMVRMPTFYALWVAYCLGTTAGLMTISQLVPFAQSAGMAAGVAGLAGAIGSASGRIVSGWLSDLIGRLSVLRIMILVSAIAMPALFIWREQAFLFYLLVFAVYWCFGTQLSVFATTAADFFGTKYLGLNYGLLFTAYGVAGIIGRTSPAVSSIGLTTTATLLHCGRPGRCRVALARAGPAASPRGSICADLSLRGPCHKYGRIRPPMHPAPRRSSSVEYCRYAPLLAPCGAGAASISTPSVCSRIYDTDH